MVIKASTATEVGALVDALGGDDDVHREAAIARLGVIGARAVDRLTGAYAKAADRRAHLAILRALEVIGDYRSAPLAREALGEGGDVAVAATGILRALLSSSHATTAAQSLDTLIATALDVNRDRRVRLAAFDALQDLPAEVRARVADALRGDEAHRLSDVADAMTTADREAARAGALWNDAVDGRLPDAPDQLRDALATRGASVPLNTLRALVDAVRARERAANEGTRQGWLVLRGAVHQALALRGSRVALYDLRESLEGGIRLPASFLMALHVLGDASCLEPIAVQWDASARDTSADGARWRQQLAAAFKAIAQREKITKRHAVMKKIAARGTGILT